MKLAAPPILALVLAGATFFLANPRQAAAQPAIDAAIISGVDQDMTAIGRLYAGGLYGFGKVAAEAHLAFDGFLRIGDHGINARSVSLLDVGGRYGFMSDHFVGPYVTGGASFGYFIMKPNDRKVPIDDDACDTAVVSADQDNCNFKIDKNASFRLGFGYGFASSGKTTVGVRLDINYWLLSVAPFEDQPVGAPIPRQIPRPQDSWSFMIGLEFMRWR